MLKIIGIAVIATEAIPKNAIQWNVGCGKVDNKLSSVEIHIAQSFGIECGE